MSSKCDCIFSFLIRVSSEFPLSFQVSMQIERCVIFGLDPLHGNFRGVVISYLTLR